MTSDGFLPAHDECADFPICACSQRPVSAYERMGDIVVVAPCDEPATPKVLGKLSRSVARSAPQPRKKSSVPYAAKELQQIVPVFHPVADREAIVVERAGVEEFHVKLERFEAGLKVHVRTFRKLRGSGRLVLLDRLAVGFVA